MNLINKIRDAINSYRLANALEGFALIEALYGD